MAIWKSSKREFQVPCRCLVGRSALADLRLESRRGSSEHAAVGWYAGRWILRDLGSSNGTKINDRPLFPGDRIGICSGSRLQFGDDGEVWTVLDDEPPDPCGVLLGPQRYCWGVQALMVLPSEESPEASVFADADGWRIDTGNELRAIECGDIVPLASGHWRLLIPDYAGFLPARTAGPEVELSEVSLSFAVSPAKIAVVVHHGATSIAIPARACLQTLSALARLRLQSTAPEHERGWVSSLDLAGMLRCSPEKVNVDVHRLRKLFQEVGVRNAAQIIERDDTKRLRIAIRNIVEETPYER